MTTLFSAIDECGNTAECISSWYQNRTYNGTLGTIRFDENGVAYYPIGLEIIRDGQFEPYEEENRSMASPIRSAKISNILP